jgi:protoporphyrinogen IX oxidase
MACCGDCQRSDTVIYLWTKTFHLLFVIAWMAAVFYLPRILVNMAEARGEAAVEQRLALMGRRLYAFGHAMSGLVFVLGFVLWFGFRLFPGTYPHVTAGSGWMHAKFLLVLMVLAFFIWTGKTLKKAAAGGSLPSAKVLRWINELPIVLVLAIVFLVLAKQQAF